MKIAKIDLHNHTYGSDGKQFPLGLLQRACKEGANIVSITDHNSVKGYRHLETQVKNILERAEKCNYEGNYKWHALYERVTTLLEQIKIIKGVEVMAQHNGNLIEVLGYNIDIPIMEKELQELKIGLKPMGQALVEGFHGFIDKYNPQIDKASIKESKTKSKDMFTALKNDPNFDFLMKDVNTLKEFITKHMYNPESPLYINCTGVQPSIEQVVASIHKAGGTAILAHPGRYHFNIHAEMDNMINKGLDGIEVWHPDNAPEVSDFLLAKVREHKLRASGGSDDHRNPKEGEQYYIGTMDVQQIPETAWIEESICSARDFARESDFMPRAIDELEEGKKKIEKNMFLASLKVTPTQPQINTTKNRRTTDKTR